MNQIVVCHLSTEMSLTLHVQQAFSSLEMNVNFFFLICVAMSIGQGNSHPVFSRLTQEKASSCSTTCYIYICNDQRF